MKLKRYILSAALGLMMLCAAPVAVQAANTSEASNYEYVDITDAYWNGTTAIWSIEGKASKYQVRLFRDDTASALVTRNVTTKKVSFKEDITKAGIYYFEVRGYNSKGGWSDWWGSDEYELANDIKQSSVNPTSSTSSTYSVPGTATDTRVSTGVYALDTRGKVGWIQYEGNWCFKFANGVFAINSWEFLDGKWYHFDENGWMQTGWLYENGNNYYLYPDGAMATGSVMIDGVIHVYDTSGRMIQ